MSGPYPSSKMPAGSGKYAIHDEIASGGMATIHLGRNMGPVGFSRTVAIKKLHPHYAKDPDFVSMFMDEARLAGHVRHRNVVQTLDVVSDRTDLFLVMEYVEGESLSRLWRTAVTARDRIPIDVVSAVMSGSLHGLHAVHEARDEHGEPLNIVHRDISPQNVLVGVDGVPRLLDFGVAKAAGRVQQTREGQLKGKIAYMAPELLMAGTVAVSRQTDIYASGVVLWELLTGARLYDGESDALVFGRVLQGYIPSPRSLVPDIPPELDAVVMCAVDRDPSRRFATAHEMALALEASTRPASAVEVGQWVEHLAHENLAKRASQVAELESAPSVRAPLITPSASSIPLLAAQSGPEEAVRLAQAKVQSALDEGAASSHAVSHPSSAIGADAKTRSWGPPATTSSARISAMTTGPFSSPGLPDQSGRTDASIPAPAQRGRLRAYVATACVVFALAAGFLVLGLYRRNEPETPDASLSHASPPSLPAAALPGTGAEAMNAVAPSATPAVDASPPATEATSDAIDPSTLPIAAPPNDGRSSRSSSRSGGKSGHTSQVTPITATPSAKATASAAKATPSGAKSPSPPVPNCDPPFTRDEQGVKVYKEECLK